MKYSKEEYENAEICAGEDAVLNYKSKIVQIRKTHTCVMCQKEIVKGESMLRESGFMDGAPVSCYTCIPCLDKWLDEINEVDEDGED